MILQNFFESPQLCPECGGPAFTDLLLAEKQDACYHKVRSRYKVWPSAYASGALVQCRKKGAANWGNKNESADDNFGKPAAMMKASPDALKTAQSIVQKQADRNVIGQAKIAGAIPSQGVAEESQTPEKELERLKLRQNAEHGGASLKRQAATQARIRELEKQIKVTQGVAEGLDPEKRARLDDLIDQYRTATDPEAYYGLDGEYEDPEEVLNMIRAEFGNRVAGQIEAGADKMHYPRPGHSDWKPDPLGWKEPVDRITKAGKMYKQDSDYRKNTIKSRYGLSGKSATEGVAEGSVNDYFKRRKDEEDRIAGTKAPAKRTPQQTDYAKRRAQDKKSSEGVTEGSSDTIYPNAEVIKSKNGKPVGEIYQDGNSWGAFHYRADRGYDFIDSREEAIEALKDLHQETGRSRPDYTIKGVAEGSTMTFNDDDWYEFDPNTLRIIRTHSPGTFRKEWWSRTNIKRPYITLPNGNHAAMGLSAKHMGLHMAPKDVAENNNEKIADRHDPNDFDDMVRRLRHLAGQGPMKTVWDEKKRVYRNMPTAVQPSTKNHSK